MRRVTWIALLSAGIGCSDAAGHEASVDESGSSSSNLAGSSNSAGQGAISSGSGGSILGGGGAGQGGSGAGSAGATAREGGVADSGSANADVRAPPATWINATGNLAGKASDCVALGTVAIKPGSSRIIAGVALDGLFTSDDGGKSWQPMGTGAGSAKITNRVSSIAFDREHPDVFWETGTHTGPGFYKTTDGGSTFKQLGTMTFSQSVTIDFADSQRSTLLVGTHGRGIYRTTDGGQTFTDISAGVTGNTLWPLLIDARTYLVGTVGDNGAVFRTTDAGASWSQVTTLMPSHDGAFLRASDDSLYLPIAGNAGIMKSTDLGRTWTKLAGSGATFPTPFFSVTPIELPDRTLVALGVDHLLRSRDGGASWKPIGEPFPFKLSPSDFGGVTYSVETKTFFVWHSDCGTAVLPDAIMSAGFDFVDDQ